MNKQDVMVLLANMLNKKLIFIETECWNITLNPSNTVIIFDKETIELKSFYADVTLRYDSIQKIDIINN